MRHEILSTHQANPVHSLIQPRPALVDNITTRYPTSQGLPVGSQRRLMIAADFSRETGHSLNTILTINAAALQQVGSGGVFGVGHLWDGLQTFLELLRKWVTARGLPWVAIWVREWGGAKARHPGEHWHIGFHLPAAPLAELPHQVSAWTSERPDAAFRPCSEKGYAQSEHGSWHIGRARRGGRGPEGVAAYFGKAEPNTVRRYRKRCPNRDKPRPDKYGGAGPIEGRRFGVSRAIDLKAQTDAGFVAPSFSS